MWLQVEGLKKEFAQGNSWFTPPTFVHALRGVTFGLEKGETLAVVGESGCGKSTLARCLVGLLPVTSGTIHLGDEEVSHRSSTKRSQGQQKIQMVFQDPFSSLNPRLTVAEVLEEPLILRGGVATDSVRNQKIAKLLETVGLAPLIVTRFPHELSGGQRQRVGIARALAMEPELLICDEPVSALDVSIQAQILNLFLNLQNDLNLTMIFITHDLRIASLVSHRIVVFYLGEIVEEGKTSEVFANPRHPYTRSLLSSIPKGPGQPSFPQVTPLEGEPPSPVNLPMGCSFYSRCFQREDRCREKNPVLASLGGNHRVACWPETDVLD